ncbi:MAG: hypothetical protein M1828_007174 [Chrysothrix sp. TS-e1954]|nr:MAG: hypothetical protein M1828_007174 [Chrysothrix sp. TS-e1954]
MAANESSTKLWGGRFTGSIDPLMMTYNASLPFDRAFYAEDVRGSIAYARANTHTGILTSSEFSAIQTGLEQIEQEWKTNKFQIKEEIDEDIHTANERRLGEIIGKETAGKLHTGRSRNDQVATDMRLWLRNRITEMQGHLKDLLRVFAARAGQEMDALMPGYTHLQPAQPVRWSHFLMSHAESLSKDLDRLSEVQSRVNLSPLGCGALAGNPFNVDRRAIANELGFDGLIANSMSAVSDRDFVLEFLQWASMLMNHISRFAEDLIIYSSSEFGFVSLSDAYSTGSSLMPQKRNPDSLELLRGKAGRVLGQATGLAATTAKLPSTYDKDLQESVEPMLDSAKTVSDSLQIATGVLSTLSIRPERMRSSLSPEMLATDLADYLVRKGVNFRETHHVSGKVVALAESERMPMDKLGHEKLKAVDERFERDVMDVFDFERSVEARNAEGGTSRGRVIEQVRALEAKLK